MEKPIKIFRELVRLCGCSGFADIVKETKACFVVRIDPTEKKMFRLPKDQILQGQPVYRDSWCFEMYDKTIHDKHFKQDEGWMT